MGSIAGTQVRAAEGQHQCHQVCHVLVGGRDEVAEGNELRQSVDAAVVQEAKAGAALCVVHVEAGLFIQGAQLRHLEITAAHGAKPGDMQVILTIGSRGEVLAADGYSVVERINQGAIAAHAGRCCVAGVAAGWISAVYRHQGFVDEQIQAAHRIAASQRLTGRTESAGGEMAVQGQAALETVVEIAERVGWDGDGIQEVFEFLHLRFAQLLVITLQDHVGGVEFFDTVAVAAPVERLVADDILQRLGDHGTFHGVERATDAADPVGGAVLVKELELTGGVAQVPGQAVALAVHVAGRTGQVAQPRGFVGAVKVFASGSDRFRQRIMGRDPGELLACLDIHHREFG